MERRLAELDRIDAEHGLGTLPEHAHAQASGARNGRARQQGRSPVLPALLVVVLTVGVGLAFSPSGAMEQLRRLVGMGPERLGAAPDVPEGDGSYAFLMTQRFGGEPVGYSPCREIEVRVNPAGAPRGWERLVETSIRRTSEATGLKLVRGPDTDLERIGATFTPSPRPVLVAWSTADRVPELAGRVAGIGGSTAVESGGRLRYVTGEVILDRDVFDDFSRRERPLAQAIVDHEFAHLVGLDHVDDPGELMNAENNGMVSYGPGDRAGLAALGRISC